MTLVTVVLDAEEFQRVRVENEELKRKLREAVLVVRMFVHEYAAEPFHVSYDVGQRHQPPVPIDWWADDACPRDDTCECEPVALIEKVCRYAPDIHHYEVLSASGYLTPEDLMPDGAHSA